MKCPLLAGSFVALFAFTACLPAQAQSTQVPPLSYRAPIAKTTPSAEVPAVTSTPAPAPAQAAAATFATPAVATPAPAAIAATPAPAPTAPAAAAMTTESPVPAQTSPQPVVPATMPAPAPIPQVPAAAQAAPIAPIQTTPEPPAAVQNIPAPAAAQAAPVAPVQTIPQPAAAPAPVAPVPAVANTPAPAQSWQQPAVTPAPQPQPSVQAAPAAATAVATPAAVQPAQPTPTPTPAVAVTAPAPAQATPATAAPIQTVPQHAATPAPVAVAPTAAPTAPTPVQEVQPAAATPAPTAPPQTAPPAATAAVPTAPAQSLPQPAATPAPQAPVQAAAPAAAAATPAPVQPAQPTPTPTPVVAATAPVPAQAAAIPVATPSQPATVQSTPTPLEFYGPPAPVQTTPQPVATTATTAPVQPTQTPAVTYAQPTPIQSTQSPAIEFTQPAPATAVTASAPTAPAQATAAPAAAPATATPAQTSPTSGLTYAPPTPGAGVAAPAKTKPVPTIDYSVPVASQQTTPAPAINYAPPVPRSNPREPADLIIHNARVLTVDASFSVADAVAIRSNTIVAVGSDHEVMQLQGTRTRMIDAGGKPVMPGIYDAQVDSWRAAVSELSGPLPVLDSIAAAQEYIRKKATNTPAGGWIIFDQLYSTRLKENRFPTKAELDAATTNVPVCWNFGPVSVVNSKALEVSRITRETTDPKGGEIIKDRKTMKPTGLLRNKAVALLRLPTAPPAPSAAQRRTALKRLYALYNQRGITSIGELAAEPASIEMFRSLARSNELTVRVNCTRVLDPATNNVDDAIALLDALTNAPAGREPYGPTGTGNDWVRIGALKAFLDGDVAVATAYLRTPYGIGPTYQITEPAYRAKLQQDLHVLPEFLLEAARRNWQVTLHCAGDAALDFAMNTLERVQFDLDIHERRFSVTHNVFQAVSDWDRCVKLGIAADLQPTVLYQDGASLLTTLGEPRLENFLPVKSWLDHGLLVGASSGHSAGLDSFDSRNPWNPWLGMWAAISRETHSGFALNPREAVSREQAVRLYTINNARLNFEEKKKGSLETGKLADLIMLDTDITKCPVDDIRATGVLLTVVNGQIVWEARNNLPNVTLNVGQPMQQQPQPPQPQ